MRFVTVCEKDNEEARTMNELQFSKAKNAEGFIAALDQSGWQHSESAETLGIEDGATPETGDV